MTLTRLAIDLGTSHTVGVVRRDGQPVRALLFDGSPLLPSGVAVGADGILHTGRDAERVAQVEPDRFEPHPKRRVDEGSVLLGERVVAVSEMLAAILSRVVAEGRTAGVPLGAATVLTCPADWGGPRRDVLRVAARRAGLGEVMLVDEPIAAAAYCMAVAGQRLYTGQALAVFDFGGGTLDVTVVRRDADQLRVLATGGLDDLGGLDVDAAVVGHLGHLVELRDPGLWQRLQAPADAAQARDRRAFWTEARAAKEMLSRTSSAPVQVPGRPDALHLTRDELERIAGPLIARAVDETRRVVERAGLTLPGSGAAPAGTGLAGVLLVGGSSRIPLVASRLHARLGVAPTTPEQPELPVAHGALLLAESGGAAAGYAPPVPGQRPPGAPGQGPGVPAQRPGGVPVPAGAQPTSGAQPATGNVVSAPWPEHGTVSGSPLFGSPVTDPRAAAYAGSPVSGAPVSPLPGPPVPPPPAGPWPPRQGGPQGGPPVVGVPVPPRKRTGRRIAVVAAIGTVLVVALVAGLLTNLVRDGAQRLGSGNPLGGLTGGGGGSGKLELVHDVAVGPGGRAVATDGDTAYYAASGTDTTKVEALPAAGGKARWTATVRFGAARLRLAVVNGVLILDGQQSTLDQDARAAVDARTGKVLWAKAWSEHFDLAYVGTDALVEARRSPTSVSRVDLRTGRARWSVPGPDSLLLIDERLSKAAVTWPAAVTARKPGDPLGPTGGDGFKESLLTGTDVVMLDQDNAKGKVIDGATGKVRRAGSLALDDERWTVFDGLVIGEHDGSGGAAIDGYRLSDLKRAWQFRLVAGSSVEGIRPCGPKRICVVAEAPGSSDAVVHAIDVTKGREVWQHPTKDLIDVGWFVVDGKLILGEDSFGSISEAVVVDPDNKEVHRYGERSVAVVGSDRGRVMLRQVRLDGTDVVFQIAVADLASGKATGGVDLGGEPPAGAALAGETLVVLSAGADARVKVLKVSL